jgi:DTW domain-containing protein YfiP
VSPAIRVISTEFTDEISYTIANLDTKYTLILYPSPESTAIENVRDAHSEIKTIILLDGSWKQAYSIWQSFPTLRTFTAVHFDSPPLKQYGIRKSKKTYQLSSIEALSYSVSTLTNIDTSAYAIALAKMKHHWHNIKNERAE